MNTTRDKNDDQALASFKAAVDAHQHALQAYGEDDERTVDALLRLMLLAPDEVFAEIEAMACATRH